MCKFSFTADHPCASVNPARRRPWWQRLALLIICNLPLQTLPAGELSRLALALNHAPQAVRSEFAIMAIYQTATSYSEEAERARGQDNAAQRRDSLRWARGVDAYVADLWRIQDSITELTPVSIHTSPQKNVEIHVAGSTVVLSGPRPQQQILFEQGIIERFCVRYHCEELVTDFHSPQLAPDKATQQALPATRWSFSERAGPVCSSEHGLEFQFKDTLRLRQKHQACERVVAELNQLVKLLVRYKNKGMRIDWNYLSLHSSAGRDQQLLELNSDGDTVTVSLPALATTGKLIALVRPWLSARTSGSTIRQVVINADTLMEPLFGADPAPAAAGINLYKEDTL